MKSGFGKSPYRSMIAKWFNWTGHPDDDPPPPPPGDPPPPPPAPPPPSGDDDPIKRLKFTPEQQEFFNKKMQEQRILEEKKFKGQNDRTIQELKKLQAESTTTAQQKEDLQKRIKELENQYLSKEELQKQESERKEKEFNDSLKQSRQEAERWKGRFEESTITRAIQDAAIEFEAFNPSQIVDLLFQKARVVEEKDEEDRPTGNFIPRIALQEQDAEGKVRTLDLTVKETLSKMKNSSDRFGNLFKSGVAGGLGANGSVPSGRGSRKHPAKMTPAEHMKARKEDPNYGFTKTT